MRMGVVPAPDTLEGSSMLYGAFKGFQSFKAEFGSQQI